MTIVVSIIGAAVGIVGVLGMMLRTLATNVAKQFDSVDRRLDELKTDMRSQFGETTADCSASRHGSTTRTNGSTPWDGTLPSCATAPALWKAASRPS